MPGASGVDIYNALGAFVVRMEGILVALGHLNTSERVTVLLLSVFAFWLSLNGLRTGRVWLKYGEVKRSDDPQLFWFGVVLQILFGLILLQACILGTDKLGWN